MDGQHRYHLVIIKGMILSLTTAINYPEHNVKQAESETAVCISQFTALMDLHIRNKLTQTRSNVSWFTSDLDTVYLFPIDMVGKTSSGIRLRHEPYKTYCGHSKCLLASDFDIENFKTVPTQVKLSIPNFLDLPGKEDLCRLVWEKPLTELAVDLGVNSDQLKRHCNRIKVDRPPRGYWASYASSKDKNQISLSIAG